MTETQEDQTAEILRTVDVLIIAAVREHFRDQTMVCSIDTDAHVKVDFRRGGLVPTIVCEFAGTVLADALPLHVTAQFVFRLTAGECLPQGGFFYINLGKPINKKYDVRVAKLGETPKYVIQSMSSLL